MISTSDTQTKATFSNEELDMDILEVTMGSCNNPQRMYWFTPDQLYEEIDNKIAV